MTSLRLVFAGSPAAAVPTLRALAVGPHVVTRVITRPPAPVGRRRVMTPTPVAREAETLGIPVVEATRLHDVEDVLRADEVDLGVIVAYGTLVREPLLSWPRLGWINLHFSLLPRWRGAAPVQHALIAGEKRTGATVFQLGPGLDDGEWFAQADEGIPDDATAGSLLEWWSERGADLTVGVVDDLSRGVARARPQEGEPTLAPKLGREDGRLDWSSDSESILARWRGVTPEPGAWATTADGTVTKIHELARADEIVPRASGTVWIEDRRVFVGTGGSPLELRSVQPAGKQSMSAADWARGWASTPPQFS